MQEEGTSAGLDGPPPPGMSRLARTADEAEAASKAAEEMTPVTYNYSFFHLIFALASMYLAMLMTGAPGSDANPALVLPSVASCRCKHWLLSVSELALQFPLCTAEVPCVSSALPVEPGASGTSCDKECDLLGVAAGWGTGAEEKDLIDVGWFSVWVKFVTQWVTAATYCWMLVAPSLYPDRVFA